MEDFTQDPMDYIQQANAEIIKLKEQVEFLEKRNKDIMVYIDRGSELKFIHHLFTIGLVSVEHPIEIKSQYMKWLTDLIGTPVYGDEIFTYEFLKLQYDNLVELLEIQSNYISKMKSFKFLDYKLDYDAVIKENKLLEEQNEQLKLKYHNLAKNVKPLLDTYNDLVKEKNEKWVIDDSFLDEKGNS